MFCRRCPSADLIALEVFHPEDYPVYRCRRCGFLFSPGPAAADAAAGPESAATRKPAGPESAAGPKPAGPESAATRKPAAPESVNAKPAAPGHPAASRRRRRDS